MSNHPTLREVAEKNPNLRVFTLSYLTTALTNYLDFMGRRNTMNDEQVAETAELMLEEYPDLKFDDIALFFRNCKLSRYGKLYDLNGAALLDWLREYKSERSTASWRLAEQQKRERKEAEERQRQAKWEAMTDEERAESEKRIAEIQERIRKKLSGELPYKHTDRKE